MGKTICYGVAGEGLGHVSRTISVMQHMPDVKFKVFTFGDAYNFLIKNCTLEEDLHEIPGLRFGRVKNKVNNWGTIKNFLSFLPEARKTIDDLSKKLVDCDLFISDFEPIIARVAHKVQKPLISIDNQHKFSRCKISNLPINLRLYAYVSGKFIERYIPSPDHSIIANLCPITLKSSSKNTTLVNCLLRKHVAYQEVSNDGFLLVYWKKSLGEQIFNDLKDLNLPVVVYGAPGHFREKWNFSFKEIDYLKFAKDMARCEAVIGGAGNQLLGEAIYFGKPVFAIPEPNQQEQAINAFYIETNGAGRSCVMKNVNSLEIYKFLKEFGNYPRKPVDNGIHKTIEIIKNYL